VHSSGLRVVGVLGAPCSGFPAQRCAAHGWREVRELAHRRADERTVGHGELVAHGAEVIAEPGLIELDALRADRLVDEPPLLAQPSWTSC
jgi:hypothetical protein